MNLETAKICSKCNQVKDIECFAKDSHSKDGLFYWCKDCYSSYYKEYRMRNQKKLSLKNSLWVKNNWNNLLTRKRQKYQTDKKSPAYLIKKNLRTRIWLAIRGINKSQTTIKLLGCSIEFLKKHLEVQFQPGMSWDNYGQWHIDHIKPCAKFDLTRAEEQKKCFHYSNLQPLWAQDNRRKYTHAN